MKHLLLATFFCAAVTFLPAQSAAPKTPDTKESKLTPEQTATIIKQLDALESTIGKNRSLTLSGALTRCSKAVAAGEPAALQLYLDCYKLEHFERMNLKVLDYQEWAKRNADKHKDPEFRMALWLQLDYLVLTIQAQDAKEKDMPILIASLQSFISRVITAIQGSTKHTAGGAVVDAGKPGRGQSFDAGKLQQMLHQSVKNSEFAKALQLDSILKKEDWTYDPMDIRGIYERVIFPYYIEKKPDDLSTLWDNLIKSELAIKAATSSEAEFGVFYKERYPEMLWRKAEHLVSHHVNTIMALADMLKLIRDNPTHPNAGNWAKKLRELVNSAQPPGGP